MSSLSVPCLPVHSFPKLCPSQPRRAVLLETCKFPFSWPIISLHSLYQIIPCLGPVCLKPLSLAHTAAYNGHKRPLPSLPTTARQTPNTTQKSTITRKRLRNAPPPLPPSFPCPSLRRASRCCRLLRGLVFFPYFVVFMKRFAGPSRSL